MAESLWRIAHLLTGNGHFFREHAQVIRVGQDVIKVRKCEFPDVWNGHIIFGSLYFQFQPSQPSSMFSSSWQFQKTYTSHGFNKPEGYHDEGTLTPCHTCATRVSVLVYPKKQ